MAGASSECVVCMTEARDTLVLPCRHMCLCSACAEILRFQSNKCPICRSPFHSLLQLRVAVKSETNVVVRDGRECRVDRFRAVPVVQALDAAAATAAAAAAAAASSAAAAVPPPTAADPAAMPASNVEPSSVATAAANAAAAAADTAVVDVSDNPFVPPRDEVGGVGESIEMASLAQR